MRRLCLILFLLVAEQMALSQVLKVRITGSVKEAESGAPALQAAVQLLSVRDSSLFSGTVTDPAGRYSLLAPEGDYILKISSLGFMPRYRNIHVTPSDGELDFGVDAIETDAISLKAATVVQKAPPMVVMADTLMYNPSAFIVDDDADLSLLLDRIPGIEVNNGTVLLHGRPVRELLVNGKRFFGGDVKTGLKNIPARMLDKIKAYDRPSDFARITGIDDGEEEPVLDLIVKPSFMKGWNNELRGAGGTGISPEGEVSGRYKAHFDANRVTKETHTSIIANASNINNAGSNVSGRNQTGSGTWGDGNFGDAGASYASKKPGNVMNGSLRYNWNSRWADGLTRSENVTATSNYPTDTKGQIKAFNNDINAKFDYEWRPDKKFTFFFKPSLGYIDRGYLSLNRTNTYNSSLSLTNDTHNRSEDAFRRLESNLQVVGTYRSQKRRGRSVSAQVQLRTFNSWDGLMYDLQTHYHNKKSKVNPKTDSIKLTRSFMDTRLGLYETSANLSWNEPIAGKMHIQATYRIAYKYYNNSRSLYDFLLSDYKPEWSLPDAWNGWHSPDALPPSYEDAYYPSGSAYGTYHYIGQTLSLNFRYIGKKMNLVAGVVGNRQHSKLIWPEAGHYRDTSVGIWNFAPNLSLRYKHTKSTYLVLTYRSWAGQPGVDRMLPVANNTNPLYIRKGNPGLKPNFTQAANFSFNTSNLKKHFSLVLNAEARLIQNAVSSSTEYDASTGARTVTPVNIDGTWWAKGSLVINYTFPGTLLSLSSNTSTEYHNTPSYLYNSKLKADELNNTGRFMIRERATLSYRHKWFEALFNLRGEYTAERSSLRPELNQDPFTVSAGLSLTGRTPWKMTVTTEFTDWIQRGFIYNEYNKDYYLLNFRVSQRFLKGKLTLSLIGNDLLGQMINLNRTFSSERRAVAEYNGINRYVILQAIWRFKVK